MQQHLMQMQPMMAAYYPNNVTTDHIQQVSIVSEHLLFMYDVFESLLSVTRMPNLVCEMLIRGWFGGGCNIRVMEYVSTKKIADYVYTISYLILPWLHCLLMQYLDENKSLILKIVESQNSGKLSECAENQARLQRNLMYLAAIADSQPQPPSMHGQFPSGGIMQPGSHYMQHQQAQQMTPQSLMAARSSMLYSQQPLSALQQQQVFHGQLGMSSGGSTGLHMLQSEGSTAGGNGSLGAGGFPDFSRGSSGEGLHGRGLAGGSKQDMGSAGSADGRGGSSGGPDGGETIYLKGADDGN
ncbi:hypothetical protein Patl1_23218 [Pistacia atlantica]|uniref:Uncharacterized protein n=1 Tax=Pistacia atlantica TaxID=434234 RepID=A0ACC0ZU23_9ROSI|nr:hypothetical protein Patl1_23218 [Pistacia atlantica]